jgi:hypothetical protein
VTENEINTQRKAEMKEKEIEPVAVESLAVVVSQAQWNVCSSHSLAAQCFLCSHEIVLVTF